MSTRNADIALVSINLKAGGSQRVMSALANAWARQGRGVCVITLDAAAGDFFALDKTVSRVRLTSAFVPAGIRRLREALRRCGAPVVVSFLTLANVYTICAAVGLGLQVVISERNDPVRQPLPWRWRLMRRALYRFAHVVAVNSRGAMEALQRFVPAGRLAFVPNPVPVPQAGEPVSGGAPLVLMVGRLTHQKGHDVMLDAFAAVAGGFPDWRLAVAGDGQLKAALVAQAGRLGIGPRVDWHGEVTDLSGLYRSARIFALPSRFEGAPNALLEALSYGLPVIVSDASPGPLEYVEHELNGLVVPPDNSAALAAALTRLMRDDALRRRLAEKTAVKLQECSMPYVLAAWNSILAGKQNE